MIFVLNRHEQVEAVLSNDNPDSCPYLEDKLTEDLYTGAASYEFKVPTLHPASDYINVGDFIIRKGLDNDLKLFQVIQTEEVSSFAQEKHVYAETAGLELLNDIVRPANYMSQSAKQILDIVLKDTRWNRGIVEYLGVDNFYFENYDNVFSVLQAVADKLGGELIFRATMKNGEIKGRYIDLIKKRGTDTKKRFVYNKDIKSVWRKTDISQLATALIGVGKGTNGEATTFKSISRSKSGGDAFNKPLNQDWIGDPGALQQFGVKGKHIFRVYEYDTADPNVLLDRTWAQLQKVKNPSVTYELDVALLERLADIEHESVRIGDTVYIVDEAFSPPLYLEARVINLETCFTDPSKDKCTLGNYKVAKSNITQAMRNVQSKLLKKESQWDEIGEKIFKGPTPPIVIKHTWAEDDLTKTWEDEI